MANEASNPTFDSDVVGWQATGTGASIAYETTVKRTGAGSCAVSVANPYTGLVQDYQSATVGRSYRGVLHVLSGTFTGAVYIQLTAYDSGWGTLDQTSAAGGLITPNGATWTAATSPTLVAPSGTAHLELALRADGTPSGTQVFYADDAFLGPSEPVVTMSSTAVMTIA